VRKENIGLSLHRNMRFSESRIAQTCVLLGKASVLVAICTALPTKNQENEMKNEQTNGYFFLPVLYSWEKP
jgi:hypothetical protein